MDRGSEPLTVSQALHGGAEHSAPIGRHEAMDMGQKPAAIRRAEVTDLSNVESVARTTWAVARRPRAAADTARYKSIGDLAWLTW
jgi:hypothetical protein